MGSQGLPVKDTYRAPRNKEEYDRLTIQHEMVKIAMGGKLLLAPVDLAKPNLRVLDSGTAQALWLSDIARSVLPTATLVGTDIAPQHFPPADQRPANVTLSTHSIFDTWPEHMQESFDVVHQRFVLAACSAESSPDSVAKLFACVKPGGWIELHEGNMVTVREGPRHPAMTRFRDLMVEYWGKIRQQPDPGLHLGEWLRGAGAVDIEESVQVIKVGAEAEDPEQGERALNVLMQMLDGMKAKFGGQLYSSHPRYLSANTDIFDQENPAICQWKSVHS